MFPFKPESSLQSSHKLFLPFAFNSLSPAHPLLLRPSLIPRLPQAAALREMDFQSISLRQLNSFRVRAVFMQPLHIWEPPLLFDIPATRGKIGSSRCLRRRLIRLPPRVHHAGVTLHGFEAVEDQYLDLLLNWQSTPRAWWVTTGKTVKERWLEKNEMLGYLYFMHALKGRLWRPVLDVYQK